METVEEELEMFCREMEKRGARAVVLFGSRARNEHTEESDADVCLISDALPADPFQRRYPAPSGYLRLSVFGFYPGEFLSMLREGNPFVLDIIYYGKVLLDDGFMAEARQAYDAAIETYGLERAEKGWNWRTVPAIPADRQGAPGCQASPPRRDGDPS